MIFPTHTISDDTNPGWPPVNAALTAILLAILTFFVGAFLLAIPGPGQSLTPGMVLLALPIVILMHFPLISASCCVAAFGNALNRRIGNGRYAGLLGVIALFTIGAGCTTVNAVAFALGAGVTAAALVLMPFARVTVAVFILPLIVVGIVVTLGANLVTLGFFVFTCVLYWIFVLRSWDWGSGIQLLGEMLFFRPFTASAYWITPIVLALCVCQMNEDKIGWAPVIGAVLGLALAAIANAIGESGESESPTALEWLGWVESATTPTREPSPVITSPAGKPRFVIQGGFSD